MNLTERQRQQVTAHLAQARDQDARDQQAEQDERARRAGPQLLSALKALMADLHQGSDGGWRIGPLSDGPDSRLAAARAAISLAEDPAPCLQCGGSGIWEEEDHTCPCPFCSP